MKKTLLFIVCVLFITSIVTAQEQKALRHKYINFSFSKLNFRQNDFPALKSNYGGAFSIGNTYFFHKKPIANMIRLGIDATWIDVNYTNYKLEFRDNESQYDEREIANWHQAEISMQVGPSITVNPISQLNLHGYLRYAPSFSGLYNGDSFRGNYATFFVSGGAVSYGAIGLGIEARFGNSKYKDLLGEESNEDSEEKDTSSPQKTKFSGMRVYISLRF